MTSAPFTALRFLLKDAIDRLPGRADYDYVATEVQVVVVHRCIQDSGNRTGANQKQGSQLAAAHLIVVVAWIILRIWRTGSRAFTSGHLLRRIAHPQEGETRVSGKRSDSLYDIHCKRSSLAAICDDRAILSSEIYDNTTQSRD